ncbi:hemerythrin domain-containing protein [Rhodococcus daqingensis]|uniref:Hemerythrin domain-containing protein n=1 Tax=Rhodococcus daqingensis TaxID=2479363 RepID=A0ABW2S2P1_9NOCA
MENNPHEPADTRSMGIVHSALRRDMERTRLVLRSRQSPDGKRRRALAAHIVWMMNVLRMHHTAEDVGLWPLIRVRNPSAAALLDEMDADHKRIAPAITALEDVARAYRDDRSTGDELLGALAGLTDVLLPHLRREELEMMPVVGATVTTAEYLAVETEYFVKPKGFMELGAEGHWIIDGVSPDDREVILHVIPAVPRFVLLHAFGWRYRRRAALLWNGGPAAAVPSLTVSATADGVGREEPAVGGREPGR